MGFTKHLAIFHAGCPSLAPVSYTHLESVGSLFGSNKVKTLERENTALHRKVATHEETIEALQAEIQTIRADHSRQVLEMQQRHLLEKNETVTKHQKMCIRDS